jgi:hypothetical protein
VNWRGAGHVFNRSTCHQWTPQDLRRLSVVEANSCRSHTTARQAPWDRNQTARPKDPLNTGTNRALPAGTLKDLSASDASAATNHRTISGLRPRIRPSNRLADCGQPECQRPLPPLDCPFAIGFAWDFDWGGIYPDYPCSLPLTHARVTAPLYNARLPAMRVTVLGRVTV